MRWSGFALVGSMAFAWGAPGSAREPAPAELPTDASVEFSTAPPEGRVHDERAERLTEPPPLRPRHRGLVLEQSAGILGFAGQFRHVAPPAVLARTQLGYEVLPWLMLYADGELAYTDTGVAQDDSSSLAFPIWGFGGGLRATVHATERFAVYAQGDAGLLGADVPHDALAILGFPHAESLKASFAVRLGVEWYQIDRHLALFAALGGRDATGFAMTVGRADLPLMWDAGAGLRYTF